MPKVSIRFAEFAVADLETLKSWHDERGVPDVGDRFVEGIFTLIEALRDHPGWVGSCRSSDGRSCAS